MSSDFQEMPEQVCDGDTDWKQQANCVSSTAPYYPQGALIGTERALTKAEYEQRNRDARAQQAIYVLQQAREIRADAVLMADVRAHIRKLRDDGAALLDDIGG